MTLTTLSSKEFRSLFKWALNRNRSITVIFSIFLALGPILDMYVIATESSVYSNSISEDVCIATFVLYSFLTALFVLISAVKTFSFLHNKRSVDMYGALPSNRTTLFVSHLCAGITSIGVPYIIASIIALGITARSGAAFATGLTSILSTILMIIAAYIFTALMAYCCGTVVDTVIATLGINCFWIAAVLLCFGFMESLIPGATFTSAYNSPILTAFTPYGFGLMGIFAYDEDTIFFLSTLIWDVIFIVGFFILTLIIANKRKAESSQNGFAVKWLPMVIKAGVSVVAGGLFGFILAESSDSGFANMGFYAFWYVIISFVAFAVLHVIFARGIKGKILKSVIVYTVTTVASIGLVIGMCYGLGIDTYVPSTDSVKSVTIGGYELKDPENIKLATEIHQVIVDGVRNEYDYPYFFGTGFVYTDYYSEAATEENSEFTYEQYERMYPYITPFDFDITYNKKIGFDVKRNYYIYPPMGQYDYYDMEKLNSLIQKIVASEEYKKYDNEYLFNEESRTKNKISSVTFTQFTLNQTKDTYYTTGSAILDTDEEFLNGLYEALKKDILADDEYVLTYYDIFSDILGSNYSTITIDLNVYDSDAYAYYTTSIYFCVKDSYTNTYDYLNKHGVILTPSFDLSDYATSTYYQDLDNFSATGSYYYLKRIVEDHCYIWASMICEYSGVDFDEWYNANYDDYKVKVMNKSLELYNEMQIYYGYGGYSDDHEFYYEYYTPEYKEAETLVNSIIEYAGEYIADTANFNGNADSSSDTDNENSDTDSNKTTSENTASDDTNSKNTESKQNSSDSETNSKAEGSDESNSANESTVESSKEDSSEAKSTSAAA